MGRQSALNCFSLTGPLVLSCVNYLCFVQYFLTFKTSVLQVTKQVDDGLESFIEPKKFITIIVFAGNLKV